MTIAELRERCNAWLARLPKDVLIVFIVIVSGFLGFGLGYLSGREAGQGVGVSVTVSPDVATSTDSEVVASRSGTKFYYPWCAGADRISSANKITFASPDAARAQGYAPASNCSGL